MPKWLSRQNDNGVPANALWLTNGMVQVFLIVTLFSKASYLALISLSTAMILVPYLFSAGYGLLLAWRAKTGSPAPAAATTRTGSDIPVAAIATLYCMWLLYAAGWKYLLLSALLYAPGAAIYLLAKKQRAQRPFTPRELVVLGLLLLLALIAGYGLAVGSLTL